MINKKINCFNSISSCRRFMSNTSLKQNGPTLDFTKPEKISLDYWKKLLWVAMDLKNLHKGNNRKDLHLLDGENITLLFGKPHGRFQLAFSMACDLLGATKTMYYDPFFDNQSNPSDSAKVISRLTSMVAIHGINHDVLLKIGSSSTVPVYPAGCNIYCLQKTLSDLMTYQEKFQRLKGLKIAWIGPPSSIFNSYLLLCPKFGMELNYTCICLYGSGKMSPAHLFQEKKKCETNISLVKEYQKAEDTVVDCDIISVSLHPEEKNKVTPEILKKANKNWVFMHTLPRSHKEVSPEVFLGSNNLSWDASENYLYLAMAVILTNLRNYEPCTTKQPEFYKEGKDT